MTPHDSPNTRYRTLSSDKQSDKEDQRLRVDTHRGGDIGNGKISPHSRGAGIIHKIHHILITIHEIYHDYFL